eukprot:s2889_g9.t1
MDATQEIPLKPLNMFLEKTFNEINIVPKVAWLSTTKEGEDYEERMHILGNIVVPSCGALAAEAFQKIKGMVEEKKRRNALRIQWKFLDRSVCQRSFQELHGIGYLS